MTGNAIGGLVFAAVGVLVLAAILAGWFTDTHAHWTVEVLNQRGVRDPFNQPEFWSRRRAERYARRNTCDHYACTVVPIEGCHR